MKKRYIALLAASPFILIGLYLGYVGYVLPKWGEYYKENIFEPETRSVLVNITGKVDGYQIDIEEVKECKSWFYPKTFDFMQPYGKHWHWLDDYSYQINDDESVIVLAIGNYCEAIEWSSNKELSAKVIMWVDRRENLKEIKKYSPYKKITELEMEFSFVSAAQERKAKYTFNREFLSNRNVKGVDYSEYNKIYISEIGYDLINPEKPIGRSFPKALFERISKSSDAVIIQKMDIYDSVMKSNRGGLFVPDKNTSNLDTYYYKIASSEQNENKVYIASIYGYDVNLLSLDGGCAAQYHIAFPKEKKLIKLRRCPETIYYPKSIFSQEINR